MLFQIFVRGPVGCEWQIKLCECSRSISIVNWLFLKEETRCFVKACAVLFKIYNATRDVCGI